MPDKKPLKPHDMRTREAKNKLYGNTANRDVVHGFKSKPVQRQNSTQDVSTEKKEGE